MDESAYHKLVARTFRRIEDALEAVDPDVVETSSTGDVLTLHLPRGVRCVINTQGAVRQIWMACKDSAWHFSWDPAAGAWMDDKGRGIELGAMLTKLLHEHAGVDVGVDVGAKA